MKTITEHELLGLVRARVTESESQSAAARTFGVTRAAMSNLLLGRVRPGPKILRALGYKVVTMYQRVNTKEQSK